MHFQPILIVYKLSFVFICLNGEQKWAENISLEWYKEAVNGKWVKEVESGVVSKWSVLEERPRWLIDGRFWGGSAEALIDQSFFF